MLKKKIAYIFNAKHYYEFDRKEKKLTRVGTIIQEIIF